MMTKTMRIGIYVRVSTQEQAKEGYSIPTQINLLEAFCKSQGWTKTIVYDDAGFSAKDTNRPAFQQLKKDIQDDKIDILLVYRLDRLTRSVRDLFDILQYLEENGCAFKSATENYDTTTAMGRMFIGLVGLLAQWERENLGERVAVVLREKALVNLEAIGRQPYGYKIENKKRVIDEVEKEVVHLMIDTFKRQKSTLAVVQELNRLNIPTRSGTAPWRHETVRKLLTNPSLMGTLTYGGKEIEDAHEGIISAEEFEDLQKRFKNQSIQRLHAPTRGLFSGLLKCPQCENTLVKSKHRYRCNECYTSNKGLLHVNGDLLLKAFKEYIKGYKILEAPKVEVKRKRDYKKEIERLVQRRNKFQQMYADDFMTYDEFQTSIKENELEMDELRQLEGEEGEPLNYQEVNQMVLAIDENIEKLTNEEMIDFMAMFVKEIEWNRECSHYDKTGRARRYNYTVTNVKFHRL